MVCILLRLDGPVVGRLLLEIISFLDFWAQASPCSLWCFPVFPECWLPLQPLLNVGTSQSSVFCLVLLSHYTFLLTDSSMPCLLKCVQSLTVAWAPLQDNSRRTSFGISNATCSQFIPFSSLWVMRLYLAFLSLWIVPLSFTPGIRARLESSLSFMTGYIRFWTPQCLFTRWASSCPLLTCPGLTELWPPGPAPPAFHRIPRSSQSEVSKTQPDSTPHLTLSISVDLFKKLLNAFFWTMAI